MEVQHLLQCAAKVHYRLQIRRLLHPAEQDIRNLGEICARACVEPTRQLNQPWHPLIEANNSKGTYHTHSLFNPTSRPSIQSAKPTLTSFHIRCLPYTLHAGRVQWGIPHWNRTPVRSMDTFCTARGRHLPTQHSRLSSSPAPSCPSQQNPAAVLPLFKQWNTTKCAAGCLPPPAAGLAWPEQPQAV
jgi:hypothetical protein